MRRSLVPPFPCPVSTGRCEESCQLLQTKLPVGEPYSPQNLARPTSTWTQKGERLKSVTPARQMPLHRAHGLNYTHPAGGITRSDCHCSSLSSGSVAWLAATSVALSNASR